MKVLSPVLSGTRTAPQTNGSVDLVLKRRGPDHEGPVFGLITLLVQLLRAFIFKIYKLFHKNFFKKKLLKQKYEHKI